MTDLSERVATECIKYAEQNGYYLDVRYFTLGNDETTFTFFNAPVVSEKGYAARVTLKDKNQNIKSIEGPFPFKQAIKQLKH